MAAPALSSSASTATAAPCVLVHRGEEAYDTTFAAMRAYTDGRGPDTPDALWLVRHPAVYTLGLGADPAHILDPHDIPVVQTDRGGEVTYHGPGQAIAYLLMDLRRHQGGRLYAREFVHRIEQAVIDTLAAYNLAGERKVGAPGIYLSAGPLQGAKISALGLKVRASGCTYHGVALNVDMDLTPFSWIDPCGYKGLRTVDMRSAGVSVPLQEVEQVLSQQLRRNLGFPVADAEEFPRDPTAASDSGGITTAIHRAAAH